ncbi:Homoserine/homoserine lactone efflux protein [Methylobacterium crusticola]|uniref:Homoserine/homoserine lactone efflux protein n=1 Tax=Methylobacterium crusticola TaxID=1697972 RepID=A0ABQ4R001_9HYPH|nr:LysE family translocator [Methylobacterium crusticola]GJD50971.1 Homoserine/homoserine lactone efflux protein [Methylobacterium crusticola]
MTVSTWAAFAAASALLLVIPGPTILLVVSYAVGSGFRAALPAAIGVALGDLTAMTLSLLGLGALLAASGSLFTLLKWCGAAYLVWVGVKLWRAGGAVAAPPRAGAPALRMAAQAWLVTTLNPKSLTFFIAFLPQFLDPQGDLLTQMAIFEATFVSLALLNALGYALAASRAGGLLARPGRRRLLNRLGGGLLIGAGLAAARSAP